MCECATGEKNKKQQNLESTSNDKRNLTLFTKEQIMYHLRIQKKLTPSRHFPDCTVVCT